MDASEGVWKMRARFSAFGEMGVPTVAQDYSQPEMTVGDFVRAQARAQGVAPKRPVVYDGAASKRPLAVLDIAAGIDETTLKPEDREWFYATIERCLRFAVLTVSNTDDT